MWIFAITVLLASPGWRPLLCSAVTCNPNHASALIEHRTCAETTTVSATGTSVGDTVTMGCSSLLQRSAAGLDYCPVFECQPSGLWTIIKISCSASECYNGTSRAYIGRRTCTVSGKACQRWDSQAPHSHPYISDSQYPDESVSKAGAYCRDPDGDFGEPWCYTTDTGTGSERCGIPDCTDINIGQGACPNDYCGDPHGRIDTDNACAMIQTNMHERNVNSTRVISCQNLLQGFQSSINYCPVQRCQENFYWSDVAISCGENECYDTGLSRNYKGRQTCTSDGWPCQRWDQHTPHTHSFTQDSQFPDTTVSAAGAYCRDPDGTRGQPWCYIALPGLEWQYCSLAACSSMSLGTGTCAPTVTTTTSTTTASPTTVPITTTSPPSTTTTAVPVLPEAATTTTASPTTSAPNATGIQVQTGLYRWENASRVGFQEQYSVLYIKRVIHCAQLCLSQWMCVMITYDKTSGTCLLYRQNPEVTSSTECHNVQCFILNTVY